MKFIHSADIHLDSPLHRLDAYEGAPVDTLRRATRRAFENLVRLAREEAVDFVLIAGDLYDGDWKDYNTGLFFVSQMRRLREAEIPVFLIAGNHDAASKITKSLRLPDNVTLFEAGQATTRHLPEQNLAIHGQSFATPAIKKDLAAGYPPPVPGCFNIGLLHTSANGREGHEPYAPCSLESLRAKGYDYWALGHVHRREILSEEPWIVFPGNIQGRHIRETGAKGCLLVEVDARGRAVADFRPLSVAEWQLVEVDIGQTIRADDFLELVRNELQSIPTATGEQAVVVRIEIRGRSSLHDVFAADFERWTNEIRSVAIDVAGDRLWIESIKLRSSAPTDKIGLPSGGGPIAELLDYLTELETNPEARQPFQSLFDGLGKKLPREFTEGRQIFNTDDETGFQRLLERIRPLLIERLLRNQPTDKNVNGQRRR